MKHFAFLIIAAFILGFASTQQANAQKITFGYLSYNSMLLSMPEYQTAQASAKSLREQYEKEAQYNEDRFFKMYAEYIQGQKTFPQDIMLKRQKELQVAMDEGIKFRTDAEKLLSQAEADLLKPVEQKLDNAIAVVAKERGYSFVANTDGHSYPFINTDEGTDITSLVELVLAGKPLPKLETKPATEAPKPAAEQPKTQTQASAANLEQQLQPLTEVK